MESIEKLRTSARNMAKGSNLANHEECNLLLIIADEIEREIESRYMELPCDADGVPIHVGDMVSLNGREPFEVGGVRDTRNQWHVFPYDLQRWYAPLDLHHVKPRTVEDVLRDLVDGIGSVDFDALTAIGEAADEIRRLMEVD